MTDSLMVAETFGKQHKNVIQSIHNLHSELEEKDQLNFQPNSYKDSYGREQMKYNLTKDGFTLLVMGFTGFEAARFKEMYITEFNRMEQELKNRNVDSFMIADPIARAERWIKEQQEKRKR
ncbi:Rha family transcriptional regulator [Bacillus sp. FDAARGOS_235]|uniref:Rha family transcriptional regulator n=1 Tax=Bacillus sp. FDAARGOS_235 TaxID=1839798 RepID=UPI002105BAD0|nr:Rha family transcriptional regulator [Bacillus sp. FDAARGOS_235]